MSLPMHALSNVKNWGNGAFIIDAPGCHMHCTADRVVIGNRPGLFLWGATVVVWIITLGLGWLFWPHSRALAAAPWLVMAFPLMLALLNRQQWEIEHGVLRLRGRALGLRTSRDYSLGTTTCRVLERRLWSEPLPWLQLQLPTAEGDWIGVAENGHPERLWPIARAVCLAAGLPQPSADDLQPVSLEDVP